MKSKYSKCSTPAILSILFGRVCASASTRSLVYGIIVTRMKMGFKNTYAVRPLPRFVLQKHFKQHYKTKLSYKISFSHETDVRKIYLVYNVLHNVAHFLIHPLNTSARARSHTPVTLTCFVNYLLYVHVSGLIPFIFVVAHRDF